MDSLRGESQFNQHEARGGASLSYSSFTMKERLLSRGLFCREVEEGSLCVWSHLSTSVKVLLFLYLRKDVRAT